MQGQRLLIVFIPLLGITAGFSSWGFLPGSTSRRPSPSLPAGCVSTSASRHVALHLHSSMKLVSDVAITPAAPPKAAFFEQQLNICKRIVDEHSDNNLHLTGLYNNSSERRGRTRFKEHPRCTARFGEVLLHARDGAASSEEYLIAVHNARSIINYVDTIRMQSNDINKLSPIREGLVADIAEALSSKSIRDFRVRQIEDVGEGASKADFTLEQADLEILGRLYYSAINRNRLYLGEVGLTPDHGGFTALLALCRAASDSSLMTVPECASLDLKTTTMLSRDGARLDAALSSHFNGITAAECRFSFSRRHGLKQATDIAGRSKCLIIAFSSLGNGLVRHEFGGSLAKINNQLHTDGLDTFDVLFVADPSQSWYQKDSCGSFTGFEEYEQRILTASRPYGSVSLVGDSMGGSGAMLFSHLATKSVVAFSPQINLDGDVHVSRYDMTMDIRDRFYKLLLLSAEEAIAGGVNIFVHRGVEVADVRHTDLLMSHFPEGGFHPSAGRIDIVEHPACEHHQVASHLKEKGLLAQVLIDNLIIDHNEWYD